jgi:ElaB/YqjD/DUF883 family membrane-anchored ribosome-binding protein
MEIRDWLHKNPEGWSPPSGLEHFKQELEGIAADIRDAVSVYFKLPEQGGVSLESIGLGTEAFDVSSAVTKIVEYIKTAFRRFRDVVKRYYDKYQSWKNDIVRIIAKDASRFRKHQEKKTTVSSITMEISDQWLFDGDGNLVTIRGNTFVESGVLREQPDKRRGVEQGLRAYGFGNSGGMILMWAWGVMGDSQQQEQALKDGYITRDINDDNSVYEEVLSKVFLEDGSKNAGGWYLTGASTSVSEMERKKRLQLKEYISILERLKVVEPVIRVDPVEHTFTDRNKIVKELHRLADTMESLVSPDIKKATQIETKNLKELEEQLLSEMEKDNTTAERKQLIGMVLKDMELAPKAVSAALKVDHLVKLPLLKSFRVVGTVMEKAISEFDSQTR